MDEKWLRVCHIATTEAKNMTCVPEPMNLPVDLVEEVCSKSVFFPDPKPLRT
jgi:hypothetical protein